MVDIEAWFDCPHCGAGFTTNEDAIYTDEVEDECASQCSECKEWYQLRCVSVDIELEATKAKHPRVDQSDVDRTEG